MRYLGEKLSAGGRWAGMAFLVGVLVAPAAGQNPAELEKELEKTRAQNAAMKEQIARLEAMMVESRQRLAQLEAENDQLKKQLAQALEKLTNSGGGAGDAGQAAGALQALMEALRREGAELRKQVEKVQAERDKHLKSVVELTDQLHQAFAEVKRLKELNAGLRALVPEPPAGVGDPPQVEGLVTADPTGEAIEISLGADDGLKPGHRLQVCRTSGGVTTPLGLAVVVKTSAKTSICRIDAKSLRGEIRKGDRLRARPPAPPGAEGSQPPVPAADAGQVPHLVDGLVLSVGQSGEVEISFGADHGLRAGHRLAVYRLSDGQGILVGRLEVVRTSAKTSVCKSIPESERDTIRKGDRVTSTL